MNRRSWLKAITATGIGSLVFQRALAAQAQGAEELTADMIRQAQWITGSELTQEEVEELQDSLQRKREAWSAVRDLEIDPSVAPVVHFRPLTQYYDRPPQRLNFSLPDRKRPDSDQELAFLSVLELAALLRTRQVTSLELTQLYLQRLKQYDSMLHCVVTLTQDLAIKQARQADKEISEGRFRSLLHGIPWGAKDLMTVPGYPTTWGAPQFENQQLTDPATVYQRLEESGAVLVAKLSLGALAMGDRWFRGQTRNPWDVSRGSSGSSAGSASATAAGLVAFAIGTETLGSILSPSRVCGTVGLRPTFGAVSRHGCMPLSWTMDKVGPITRHVTDAQAILEIIQGPDGKDPTLVQRPLNLNASVPLERLRVGYTPARRREASERQDLQMLKDLGCQLVEVDLPEEIPAYPLTMVLEVEGASVFESWMKKRDVEGWNAWPRIFRTAQFVPAVDYLRAQRLRARLVEQMEALFDQVDVLCNANDLVITNLTGHPSLSFPFAFREREERELPQPCVLTGRYFDEGTLCLLGSAMHARAGTLARRPDLDGQQQALLEAEKETSEAASVQKGEGPSGKQPTADETGDKAGGVKGGQDD